MSSIAAHGGTLINRELKGKKRDEAESKASKLVALALSERELCDLEMIASGAMSPLDGFMSEDDFNSCLDNLVLTSGLPWTIPVVKSLTDDEKSKVANQKEVALKDASGHPLAILEIEGIYKHDKQKHSMLLYGTDDAAHPGNVQIGLMGNWLVGGKVSLFNQPKHKDFTEYRLSPAETREEFKKRNWRTIVAFQTRNPIHRAHEYLTKVALECVDGLLIHPLVGQTKGDDVPADVRMKCYQVLLDKYYPKDRSILAVFPAAMRYAGPREAVWHAIVRKNYGCTHFIVGRDHAGASKPDGKSYYGSYDAQLIFDKFDPKDIGIELFKFEHTFFDKKTGGMVSFKTAPPNADAFNVSGTKLREMLRNGEIPPIEITRPEVAEILIEAMRSKVTS